MTNPGKGSAKPRAKAKAPATSHKANPRTVESPLDERERLFVAAYTGEANYNGTEAARLAGYSSRGGSARIMAQRLKARPNVAAAIEAATKERLESLGVTPRAVLEEMAAIGFARADMIIEPDGEGGTRLKQAADIDPRAWAAIKSIQAVTEETTQDGKGGSRSTVKRLISVTFHDKRQALAHLMEHLNLLKGKPEDETPRQITIDFGDIKPMTPERREEIKAEQAAEAVALAEQWGE